MSKAISPSLFQLKSPGEALTLMLIGQADGIHPITALRRYHIIDGKPSMKSDAMLACFMEAGGKVKWLNRSDTEVSATFTHDGESVTIKWDMARASKAGISGRKNWQSYPCQMLTARVISEGVRLCCPQIVTGIYTPEEVMDFDKGPNQETWGEMAPPQVNASSTADADRTIDAKVVVQDPKDIVEKFSHDDLDAKKKNLHAWIMDILDPSKFQRTPETSLFTQFRDQILKDGEGLNEADLLSLRKEAYYCWLACMLCTAPKEELDTKGLWEERIAKSGLDARSKNILTENLAKNLRAVAEGKAA